MAKAKSVYFCTACGFESGRWLGRCPSCEAWNTFEDAPVIKPAKGAQARAVAALRTAGPVPLAAVEGARVVRRRTGMAEFDALLGGGIVPGSLVLLGGPPGAGKSTLLLQLATKLARDGSRAVYVCGEESAAQTKLRAQRVGAAESLLVFPETNLRAIVDALERDVPEVLVVDSIQTMWLPEVESFAGSVSQVRDCTSVLMEFAKRTGCATFVVGHVTKDGAIAGPRLLEHLVDTVLYFEGDPSGEYRIVRAYKNRFGGIDEICVFAMDDGGLHEVADPSALFLHGRGARPSGSCVVPTLVGTRPVLVEIQALVGEAAYGTPRRLAANVDAARMAMIIAILERRAGMHLGGHDVYCSVAGGLRVAETGADLGIALAIASAFRDVALVPGTVAFGELGLSGEVRTVSQPARRAAESTKLGFTRLVTPEGARDLAAAIRLAFD
ncbi:MAG: DNA repair protein RadA [Candidatus Eremiobacteraeota bacterium]|nr:DNA repair protein RadA [Candidatus Eremiobacteraeota bacterium]